MQPKNFIQLSGAHYGIAPRSQQLIRKIVSQFDKNWNSISHTREQKRLT
jgi:hypothetical protein